MYKNPKEKYDRTVIPSIYPVTAHTDHVGPGTTFVVIKGFAHNGTAYIATALKKGAATIVADQKLSNDMYRQILRAGARVISVSDARIALAQLSAQASGHAHKKLKIIGITGTKGKTTTAHLLFHLLRQAGIQTALLSTAGNSIKERQFITQLTTPQPDYLHQFFKVALENDVAWVVMEVAAQAIALHRIAGIQFDVVIMTNFAREHLEFYDSMEGYFVDKCKLLMYRKPTAEAWINKDNAWLSQINTDHTHWFSCRHEAELSGELMQTTDFSLAALLRYQKKEWPILCPTLSGAYNLSNILAATGGALSVGLSLDEVKEALATFRCIPGRLERYELANGATAIIDYAHNPLSYHAFFKTVAPLTDHLIVLFGAGGDRDHGRRSEMGAIVAQHAQVIIITTDNPRHENPEQIAAAIMRGIPKSKQHVVIYVPDRAAAIQKAYAVSKKGSIIALLGKGSETYQIIGDAKVPFSEREIISSFRSP